MDCGWSGTMISESSVCRPEETVMFALMYAWESMIESSEVELEEWR